jgi:hypothetical protein
MSILSQHDEVTKKLLFIRIPSMNKPDGKCKGRGVKGWFGWLKEAANGMPDRQGCQELLACYSRELELLRSNHKSRTGSFLYPIPVVLAFPSPPSARSPLVPYLL